MKRLIFSSMIAGALALAAPGVMPVTVVAAQKAPKGATAQCKDGSYSSAKSKQGACSNHGGVATWLAGTAPDTKQTKAASKDASRPSAEPVDTPEKSAKSAKAPAKAGDPTAQCNDGTYSYAAHHQGACSGHQGVKTWFK